MESKWLLVELLISKQIILWSVSILRFRALLMGTILLACSW
jgi:hypothetical protein